MIHSSVRVFEHRMVMLLHSRKPGARSTMKFFLDLRQGG